MGYIAVRPMKVQVAPGKVEMRQPGEAVPEAEGWPNPGVWVRRGYLSITDAETASRSGYSRKRLIPARPAEEADIKRATSHIPVPNKPLPDAVSGDKDDDNRVDLLKLSRADMEDLATEQGVKNAAGYPNKDDLADAILAVG